LFDDGLQAPTRATDRSALEASVRRELGRRGCDSCGSQVVEDLLWVRRDPWPSWLLPAPRLVRLEAPAAEVTLAMTSSDVRCRRCHLEKWSRKMWRRRHQLSVGIVGERQTTTGRGETGKKFSTRKFA
jgi:hypothetical protein